MLAETEAVPCHMCRSPFVPEKSSLVTLTQVPAGGRIPPFRLGQWPICSPGCLYRLQAIAERWDAA